MASIDEPVSTLLLLGDKEYALRASRNLLCFQRYGRNDERSDEQEITLALEGLSNEGNASVGGDCSVPIIISPPSTARFEVAPSELDVSSPLGWLLYANSPRTVTIKFYPPAATESDYVWDNFQDQLVVHTRLSKLSIRLEAWKETSPTGADERALFPPVLPAVKAPSLKSFTAIERQLTGTRSGSTLWQTETIVSASSPPEPSTPRAEVLPPLSRPSSSEHQPTPTAKSTEPSYSSFAQVQSQREATEIIMRLRCRRTPQSGAGVASTASKLPTATSSDLFPETVALDAKLLVELDNFNSLVAGARDRVAKEAGTARNELAYYKQLLPAPPTSRSDGLSSPGDASRALGRKPRQLSASVKRPSKLPSLSRPSSGPTTPPIDNVEPANNQETLSPIPPPRRRVTRISRSSKLQPLPSMLNERQGSARNIKVSNNRQLKREHQPGDDLSDFDDPDPAVDDAPIVPDDLAGVATLEDDVGL